MLRPTGFACGGLPTDATWSRRCKDGAHDHRTLDRRACGFTRTARVEGHPNPGTRRKPPHDHTSPPAGTRLRTPARSDCWPSSQRIQLDRGLRGRDRDAVAARWSPRQNLNRHALGRCTAHLGGPIAATLDAAAAVLRERDAARAERRAHGAQARLSARVLTIVPLGFAAWSAVTSQQTRAVYLSTAAGAACAAFGLMLNALGWRWINRILDPT